MYRAIVSFSGKISMNKGQIREIKDKDLVKNLLKANYIEAVKKENKKVKEEV